MIHKKLIDDNEAVSPIIGTILMVAITVIMAAIIANWSAGIKAPETPKSVGLDVSRLNQKNVSITVTSIDPPQTVVNAINITFKNGTGSTVKRVLLGNSAANSTGWSAIGSSGTYIPDITSNYVFTKVADVTTGTAPSTANVGDSATLYINDYGEFIVITVTFSDGTIRTAYSQKV